MDDGAASGGPVEPRAHHAPMHWRDDAARTMAKVLVSTVGVKLSMRRPAGPIRL
jgi:hypothetical protein